MTRYALVFLGGQSRIVGVYTTTFATQRDDLKRVIIAKADELYGKEHPLTTDDRTLGQLIHDFNDWTGDCDDPWQFELHPVVEVS